MLVPDCFSTHLDSGAKIVVVVLLLLIILEELGVVNFNLPAPGTPNPNPRCIGMCIRIIGIYPE